MTWLVSATPLLASSSAGKLRQASVSVVTVESLAVPTEHALT